MPIIGVISSSWRQPLATIAEGFVANSNPDGAKSIRSLNFTTETYSDLPSTLEISQAISYMDNRTKAGYAVGTSYTTGTNAHAYGNRGIKFDFVSKTYSSFAAGYTVADVGLLGSATNQGIAGYICGGLTPVSTLMNGVATINKMPYSTESCSAISATVSPARYPGPSGVENGNTAGYLMGGTTGNGTNVFTTINKITYSNDTLTTLSSSLATRASGSAGATHANTAGYIFGGYNNPSDTSAVGRLTFSNETADQPASLWVAMRVNWATTRQADKTFIDPGTGEGNGNTRKFTFSNNTFSTPGINNGYVYTAGWSNQGA
jgi:hypothetical protein